MLDLAKINKIKGSKPARLAKDKLYDYAVSKGLQDGIKKTYHIDKMIEMMEENDIRINPKSEEEKRVFASEKTVEKINNYRDDVVKAVPEFVDRLKMLEGKDQSEINEEELLQQLAVKRNIPTVSFIGRNPPYIAIPYWVYDYIIDNPATWYKKLPEKFKDVNTYELALSLIYYIRKDGAVTIRESRFSGFHTFIKG